MRLNGWHRIGIVASILWAIGGAFWGNELGLHEGDTAEAIEHICATEPHADLNACMQQFDKDWTAAIQYHWYYAAFVGLVPILFGWLFAYGIVRLVRWIHVGFKVSP